MRESMPFGDPDMPVEEWCNLAKLHITATIYPGACMMDACQAMIDVFLGMIDRYERLEKTHYHNGMKF